MVSAQTAPSADAAAAPAVITPGDNLVLQAIPALPASIAEATARYTQFRPAGFADWHPTRREMLILTRFSDSLQVHRVLMPGGARSQLTFFPDGVRGATYQPTTGDYFVFSKDTGGSEFAQNYRYDFATGDITLLTDGKSLNSLGVWSNRGDRMAYSSTRRNGRDRDLYVIDPRDPKSDRMVAATDGSWQIQDWSPDDRRLLVVQFVSATESYLWSVDVATGEKHLLMPRPKSGDTIAYGGGVFSRDGKGFYVTSDEGNEFQRLIYVDLTTGEKRVLSGGTPWDVQSFDLTRDGKTIAYVTNENGASVLHLLDTQSGRERPSPRLPLGTISGVSWSRDGKALAMGINSAHSPNDVYALDIVRGKVERWTTGEGAISTDRFVEPKLITWKSFDSRMMSGFLYQPDPARFPGPRPVIVEFHGGPEGQSRPVFFGRYNYLLDQLGVAVLLPNIRGSMGYGKTFLGLDNGVKRDDAYEDARTLFDWIGTQPGFDAHKIMVEGGSYGGLMTLVCATRYADRIACAIDTVGPSNLVTFLEHTEAYRRDLRRVEYGDERDPATRAWMERTAPLNNAEKATKPLFIVAGKNDPRVPYTEALQMADAVRKNGTPVWLLVANDEGHGFAKKKNADFLFYATIQFIRTYLLSEVAVPR